MAQDPRDPYYDEAGSTHSVSTASDVHDQVSFVRGDDRTIELAYSRRSLFMTTTSENEKRLTFVWLIFRWADF